MGQEIPLALPGSGGLDPGWEGLSTGSWAGVGGLSMGGKAETWGFGKNPLGLSVPPAFAQHGGHPNTIGGPMADRQRQAQTPWSEALSCEPHTLCQHIWCII